MECDWEVEIAPDAPVIDAAWDGFINLCSTPNRVSEIREAVQLPALHDVLIRLNSPSSPVRTVKCDLWPADSFDPDEMDASLDTATCGLASYIDFIPTDAHVSSNLDSIVNWCRRLCLDLKTRPCRQCRIDAIVRHAFVSAELQSFGITVYTSACGASQLEASQTLSAALATLADSVQAIGALGEQHSKYNRSTVGE